MAGNRVWALVAMIANGVTATVGQLNGLTPSEIDEIERDQSAPLFLRGTGPDPEVWFYSEGTAANQPTLTHQHFTDWLADQVRQQTRAWARLLP